MNVSLGFLPFLVPVILGLVSIASGEAHHEEHRRSTGTLRCRARAAS
jgi:hypothetical protein